MSPFLIDAYPWIKALHLIAVIAWMAGLLYLPRLFVYHAEVPVGSDRAEMLATMERRLLRAIMNPAMFATLILGLLLLATPGIMDGGAWWHAKLALLIPLFAFHMLLARWRRALAEGRDTHSPRFYRWANEVPTVLMILIVLLAVAKPF